MQQLIFGLLAATALQLSFVNAADAASMASACSAHSPAHRVALLELYTSEGCSSCPPADQFVSGLRTAGATGATGGLTADQAVLLSLHVDYWNNIGWKDPFSRAAFTERQRWLSELASSRTVYTPEIFIAGKELRGWERNVPDAVKRVNALPAQADIAIALGPLTANGLPVQIQASSALAGKLYVALVENGVASQVTAGENRGRLLRHDAVVREWLAPVALTGHAATVNRVLTLPAAATVNRVPAPLPAATVNRVPAPPPAAGTAAAAGHWSVSAFVQSDQGDVLQALSLPVCGG